MTKRIVLLALALLLAAAPLARADEAGEAPATALVVVFSHTGENYNVGVIEEGNTMKIARLIAGKTGADLFELVPAVPYPEDYDECCDVALAEQREDARPEFLGEIERWEQYETVFLGYPIWWGSLPKIVCTFLEAYDFRGKTVVPFNTHEGSRQGRTQEEIAATLPEAEVLPGLAVQGAVAQNRPEEAEAALTQWLVGLRMER